MRISAEIVSIGTELLMGQIVDTNAQHLGQLLPELGIEHYHRQTVGDNLERATQALRLALGRSDVVFTIGGLGPTEDDLTRDAVARALGVELEFIPEVAEKLRKLFALRNLAWTDAQNRQAMRPVGATVIENPNGSAPGLLCPSGGKWVICLPGPRGEFVPMVNGPVREFLASLNSETVIHSRVLRICGMGESLVEERLRDIIHGSSPTAATYAKSAEVHLRLTAMGANVAEADLVLDPVELEIRRRLGWHVYGSGETSLEEACLTELEARGQTLGTAESITGGGLGAQITVVAGSGAAFLGALVTYWTPLKTQLLGVPKELLATHGQVSAECAQAMAIGAKSRLGVDVALSTTGNAGPTPDTDGKPVGLVYVGLATPDGAWVEEFKFRSERAETRLRTQRVALTMLYRWLRGQLS
jgi:nicotinamide-nucleotide amidase